MTDEQNKPFNRRKLLRLARNASGPLALALTMLDKPFSWFFQWNKNAREREQHEWARADRRPAKVVQVGTAQETGTAMPVVAVRANQKGHLPTSKGSITVDPTIPL